MKTPNDGWEDSRNVEADADSLLLLPMTLLTHKTKNPPILERYLLAELRSTHSEPEWFVPMNVALSGLTVEQANWTDAKGNHSAGQLAYHLLFWNRRNLQVLRGEKLEKFRE